MPHWLATLIAIAGLIALSLLLTGALWLFSRWMGKVGTMAAARETQRGEGCSDGQRPEQGTDRTHSTQSSSR